MRSCSYVQPAANGARSLVTPKMLLVFVPTSVNDWPDCNVVTPLIAQPLMSAPSRKLSVSFGNSYT